MTDAAKQGQRQHYISKFLIKQWAEDKKVGVVSTYHRGHATVSSAARTLHSVVETWPRDLEHEWSQIEDRSKCALDALKNALGPASEDLAAAKDHLSEPANLRPLIDLAVLHDARSLSVPLRQFFAEDAVADSAQAAAMIQARWAEAQCYYDYGLAVTVLPQEAHVPLGAAPVFDLQRLDGRERSDVIFRMPLTPRIVIIGTPHLCRGQVEVVQDTSETEQDNLLLWSLAGEPDSFNSSYLICEPSALERIADRALPLTEGTPQHWLALKNRMELTEDRAGINPRADWAQRAARWEGNPSLHNDPNTPDSERKALRVEMRKDARKIQADLDCLGVKICACKMHRAGDRAALWEAIMPKAICDAMRREWNAAHR